MKLEVNVPASGLDLASLEGERVPLSKQRPKLHHSCEAWPSDRLWSDANRSSGSGTGDKSGPEPWFVTKISNSTDLADFHGSFGKKSKETL